MKFSSMKVNFTQFFGWVILVACAMLPRSAMAHTYKGEGRIPTMAENGYFYSDSEKKQPINVEGVVTDQDGEVLIGVNIQVKGTTQGTSTEDRKSTRLNSSHVASSY